MPPSTNFCAVTVPSQAVLMEAPLLVEQTAGCGEWLSGVRATQLRVREGMRVSVSSPLSGMFGVGSFHRYSRVVCTAPPLLKGVTIRRSPSRLEPTHFPTLLSQDTASWKSQKPTAASPLLESRF